MQAYLALRRRHQKFVDAYVECGNAAEAVRRAKLRSKAYKDPRVVGCKLKARPEIAAAIEERKADAIAEWGDRVQRWLTELDRIATFDKKQLFDENGNLKPVHALPDEAAAAIASIEIDERFEGTGENRKHTGRTHKVRTWSKSDALKTLLQFVANPPQRHEHTGKDGAPIPVAAVVAKVDDADAMALYLQMLTRPRDAK